MIDWNWKSLILQLGSALAGAFGLTFVVDWWMQSQQLVEGRDYTRYVMGLSGLIATWLLAVGVAWNRGSFGVLLSVSFIVSGLFAGTVGVGLVGVVMSAVTYLSINKIRDFIIYLGLSRQPSEFDGEQVDDD